MQILYIFRVTNKPFSMSAKTEVYHERIHGIILARSVDLLDDRISHERNHMQGICEDVVMEEPTITETTFFVPLGGLDAVNYIVIAKQIKVAMHGDVPAEHHHFVDELRSIIELHKLTFRSEVTEDGVIRKSTGVEVIQRMEDLLQRMDAVGLHLCFRMWPLHTVNDLVKFALSEAEVHDSDDLEEAQQDSYSNSNGAVVGFLIVLNTMPLMIPESGNGHSEICVDQVPDWDALPDLLSEV